jgi:hypothetical protein
MSVHTLYPFSPSLHSLARFLRQLRDLFVLTTANLLESVPPKPPPLYTESRLDRGICSPRQLAYFRIGVVVLHLNTETFDLIPAVQEPRIRSW